MNTRYIYDVDLAPIAGSTFQPTGFPDIGAATFTRFQDDEEVDSLLLESVQSMANRLEATAWDAATQQPVTAVTGLPYLRVIRAGTGEFLTSSRCEAHRLASPFVHTATLDGTPMVTVIAERLDLKQDTPLNYPAIAAAIARLDPFCLLHGVFFTQKQWLGQPRITRAVSAVIEAHGVRRAVSGGRKSDQVRHNLGQEGEGGTAEGYGSVPFTRIEWTARRIPASFVIDVELLHSYGLPEPATQALIALAMWEIRHLLDGGLRLRTACDLEPTTAIAARRGPELPSAEELTDTLVGLIAKSGETFGDGQPITVEWTGKSGKSGKAAKV
ncbi:MAG: type I-U CRISPR-associated RAMP protein Csb1/Cas7u [Mycobacterium sp.]